MGSRFARREPQQRTYVVGVCLLPSTRAYAAGDTGAVGRIAVGGKKKGRGLTFDLKGKGRGQNVSGRNQLPPFGFVISLIYNVQERFGRVPFFGEVLFFFFFHASREYLSLRSACKKRKGAGTSDSCDKPSGDYSMISASLKMRQRGKKAPTTQGKTRPSRFTISLAACARSTRVAPGQQFSGQILPSATVLVVGVGRTEAKVEGIFSEVCRLDHTRDVLEFMGGEVLKGGQELARRVGCLPGRLGQGGCGGGERQACPSALFKAVAHPCIRA